MSYSFQHISIYSGVQASYEIHKTKGNAENEYIIPCDTSTYTSNCLINSIKMVNISDGIEDVKLVFPYTRI